MTLPHAHRLLVIGLDCATPRFLFDRDNFALPTVHGLMDRGVWGILRSCDPPITVPAWSCMTTGRDPGELGVYGFRNRTNRSYDQLTVSTGAHIQSPRIWDYVGDAGDASIVLGIPQTYPPRPLKGWLISGLLTPSTQATYTYPPELSQEIEEFCGGYLIDVEDFRTQDKNALLERIRKVRDNRFDLAEHFVTTREWKFCMLVDIALDRLQHAFWHCSDPAHPDYQPGNPYEAVIPEYYRAIDERIGQLLARVPRDTAVLIVSDHGARALQGGFAINQWLIDNGYLKLKRTPEYEQPLRSADVDWPETVAWSEGGYYARVFLNVAGREPDGAVAIDRYNTVRGELAERIASIPGPDGATMNNRVLKPEDIYATVSGIAPDLLVYLGDLDRRSVGRVGGPLFWPRNDTGPDGANHDPDGVFVLSGIDGISAQGEQRADILDVFPTALDVLALPTPPSIRGNSLLRRRNQ